MEVKFEKKKKEKEEKAKDSWDHQAPLTAVRSDPLLFIMDHDRPVRDPVNMRPLDSEQHLSKFLWIFFKDGRNQMIAWRGGFMTG